MTAQFINVADASHLWSERYDRDLADVFAVQDDIAAAIRRELQGKLVPRSPHADDMCRAWRLAKRTSWRSIFNGRRRHSQMRAPVTSH